ncbi:MAG: hypothetical protein J2P27_03120 [Actinobacteria bacterium]|nr:hypothetical protein [Actinomycetota bacterium]
MPPPDRGSGRSSAGIAWYLEPVSRGRMIVGGDIEVREGYAKIGDQRLH